MQQQAPTSTSSPSSTDADLGDLEVAVAVGGEAEAVGADHGVGLEDDPVAEPAPFAHHRSAVQNAVGADADASVENHPRVEEAAAADGHPRTDHAPRVDGDLLGELRRRVDTRPGHHAAGSRALHLERGQNLGEGQVGIGADQQGQPRGLGAGSDDRRGCPGLGQPREILGIGDEGDLAGAGGIDRRHPADLQVAVADHAAADQGRQLLEGRHIAPLICPGSS